MKRADAIQRALESITQNPEDNAVIIETAVENYLGTWSNEELEDFLGEDVKGG